MSKLDKLREEGKLLQGHKGDDFYHRAWSPKARKRVARKLKRQSKRRNRRK